MRKIVLHDYGGFPFAFQLAELLASNNTIVYYLHGGGMQFVQRSKLSSEKNFFYIDSVTIQKPFSKYQLVKRWFQEKEYGNNLAKKIKDIDPDIFISATSPLDVQNIVLQKLDTKKTKFIYWWQDISSLLIKNILMRKNRPLGWLVGEYYLAMERAQLRKSQQVIAIAEEFRPLYRQWGLDEHKLHILPNWAALEEIPVLAKDNPWARHHDLHNKFVFLYSGVLALKHNPALFTGLADQFKHDPNVVVVVVSQGPGADWLRSHPRANLRLLPFQPYADYPSVLASADVLLAAIEEHAGAYSVPSKTLTYLCARRPILLSAPFTNQASRLVQQTAAGLVSPPNAQDQFCANALSLYQNGENRRRFGQNGRNYAETAFDIGTISKAFLKIITG